MTGYQNKRRQTVSRLALILLVSSILTGCTVARQSRFTAQTVTVGMDKADFVARFGAPYKTGFHEDANQASYEDWYYKENLFIKAWYEVTTILHFRNSKLVSMEPGKETPLYKGNRRNL